MKYLYTILLIALLPMLLQAQSFSASGVFKEESPVGGMGLDKVFVFKSLVGASITYTSSSPATIKPSMYINSIGDAVDLSSNDYQTTSNSCTVTVLHDSRGYVFDIDGVKKAVWVINYSLHQSVLNSVDAIEDEDKCEYLKLYISKTEDDLIYKGTNGLAVGLPRLYTIEYENMRWNDTSKKYEKYNEALSEREIGTDVNIAAPLMNTRFVLKGDQYAKQLELTQELSSPVYTAVAVEGHILAWQDGVDVTADLGASFNASAPVEIVFTAEVNKPTTYTYRWKLYHMRDPENHIAYRTDEDLKYTFTESGTYKLVLELIDGTSSCQVNVEKVFNIAESYLDAPNYFSPGDSPGSNDEFRVSYRSLVQFKCTIFNRWGVKIYEWTDPDKGWDGRANGKYVSPGVYFYVIQAKGSEGKSYKKRGDINILRSR